MNERNENRPVFKYEDKMTRGARVAGLIYLPVHMFVLPLFLPLITVFFPDIMSDTWLNVLYYGISLVFVLAVMWRFLRDSFDVLLDNKLRAVSSIFLAYLLDIVLSTVALFIMQYLFAEVENPNNEFVNEMAESDFSIILALVVFIVPIVEEVLFRGVLFGGLRRKNRVLAYVVTVAVFALYHVWQYAIVYSDVSMLLYAIQYIPVGAALCWCYERSGSIWTPIVFHMFINLMSTLLT